MFTLTFLLAHKLSGQVFNFLKRGKHYPARQSVFVMIVTQKVKHLRYGIENDTRCCFCGFQTDVMESERIRVPLFWRRKPLRLLSS